MVMRLKYSENVARSNPMLFVTGSMKNPKLTVPAIIALMMRHAAIAVLTYALLIALP